MTDITPLTQSEINDALAQLKQLSEYPTPSTQYARVLRKYFASLVEALEKAQEDGNEYAASERAVVVNNVALQDEIYGLKARIAELESRTVTVKLPVSLDFDCEMENGDYDIDEEPYLRGKIDGFNYALTKIRRLNGTAGIKWEAE
ncbi:TPA: hypothetical protein PJH99_004124 [Raoultella ornithinolytica]|nr:hypothetical protein [Raoultella ornithinolytica]HDG9799370.1 hypothetical protein [Raoultella ornithinolytica]HDG9800393.1 hypothetical protein [Raoultella ornithinolytica]HDG9835212.1 hypothetical protein [Raoultella ornithinolytica]HDH7811637.1 hypothetical protein [Raoultella ornithinolytica]